MWKYLELVRTLRGLYPTQKEIIAILQAADFEPGDFNLEGRGVVIWTGIIKRLEQKGQIKILVQAAMADFPENPVLKSILEDQPVIKSVYAGSEPVWKGQAPRRGQLEKIIGEQTTLLPISFLEMGMIKAKAVARIVTEESLGSGFLISKDNLFLTNNHVINSKEIAGKSKVQFNYQKTLTGGIAVFEEFEMDDTVFETSVDDDWTLVKIKGDPAAKYGYLPLNKATIKKDDFVNIIQHPGGEHKQIGMYHNLVAYADDNIIQYLTDTMAGSSGSPVFNSKWEVVALHHSGGWLEEPGTITEVLRNEGININKMIDALKTKGLIA